MLAVSQNLVDAVPAGWEIDSSIQKQASKGVEIG